VLVFAAAVAGSYQGLGYELQIGRYSFGCSRFAVAVVVAAVGCIGYSLAAAVHIEDIHHNLVAAHIHTADCTLRTVDIADPAGMMLRLVEKSWLLVEMCSLVHSG
jgi:hypothetical protein